MGVPDRYNLTYNFTIHLGLKQFIDMNGLFVYFRDMDL